MDLPRLSSIWAPLALTFAAVAMSAALVEGAARLSGFTPRQTNVNRFFVAGTETTWSEPDAELGWVNKAGVSRSLEEGGAAMTFWSHGRRATRPEAAVPEGRTPVMIVGGSNAQAYGVVDTDSFAYRLADRFPELSIENFGGGGYSTVQAMMMAERALENFYTGTKPKLILLGFDDSHILRNVADQSWVFSISDPEGRYVAPPHFRIAGDDLVFRPFATVGFWPLERALAFVTVAHNTWLQSVAFNTAAQGGQVTLRVLDRLGALAKSHGAVFAVAVLEDRSQHGGELLAAAPYPVIDCSGPERSDPKAYLLDGGSHPNARLHAHYADCIAAALPDFLSRAP